MIMVVVVFFMCFVSSSIDGLRLTGKPVWPAYSVGQVFESAASVTTRNAWEGNRRTSTSWLSRHKVKDSSKTSESNEVVKDSSSKSKNPSVSVQNESLSPWDYFKAEYKNRSMKYRAGEALESAGWHTLAALYAAPTLVGAVSYKLQQAMGGKDDQGEKLKTLYEQCSRDHWNPALSKWCVILKEAIVMSVGSKEAKEQVRKDRENSRWLKESAYSMRMFGISK